VGTRKNHLAHALTGQAMPSTSLCLVLDYQVFYKLLILNEILFFPRSQPPVGNACPDALRRTTRVMQSLKTGIQNWKLRTKKMVQRRALWQAFPTSGWEREKGHSL